MKLWPAFLWLVRHGESAGNVALAAAEKSGSLTIGIEGRDVDVPLSALGERQAKAVGAWFGRQPERDRPTVLLTSPYVRAKQTAALIAGEGRFDAHLVHVADERLREKEFGGLNRLTKAGIVASFPKEVALREELGKFYYRPPGGESWCDVILRLRSVLDHLELRYAGERVMIVAHQVVVLCFRYLLEELDEARLLAIDRAADVANCSLTSFEGTVEGGREQMMLRDYNVVVPIEEAGEAVTNKPDAAVKK